MVRWFEGYVALLWDKLAMAQVLWLGYDACLEPKVFPHIFPFMQAMVSKARVSVFLGEVSNHNFFLKQSAMGIFLMVHHLQKGTRPTRKPLWQFRKSDRWDWCKLATKLAHENLPYVQYLVSKVCTISSCYALMQTILWLMYPIRYIFPHKKLVHYHRTNAKKYIIPEVQRRLREQNTPGYERPVSPPPLSIYYGHRHILNRMENCRLICYRASWTCILPKKS
jgi:hypothetical protein